MRLLLKYLKKYKFWVFLNICSALGFVFVELGIPTIIADMIDQGVANNDINYVYDRGLLILLVSVVGVGGMILLGLACAKISTSITRDIRNDIFAKVQSFSHHEYQMFGVSSLITRTNNDAFQIMTFLNIILRTASVPFMIFFSFYMVARASMPLSIIIACTVPVIIVIVVIIAKISEPISEKQQESLDHINQISRENLTGVRVIRSFNNDDYEQERFEKENDKMSGLAKKLFKLMSASDPLFFFLMNIATILVFYFAALFIGEGTIKIGELVAFQDYLFHAMFSIMLFCLIFMMYPRAAVSIRRIQRVLKTTTSIQEKENAVEEGDHSGTLVFDDVTFVYPHSEEPRISHVSFEVKKGETIAFIGSTGSGKSTLVNLIPRFFDICHGSVKIDGVDVRDYSLNALRKKISMIPQKMNLFSGTIKDNLTFGKKDATESEMINAAKLASAYDFIMSKEHGFDAEVSEGATNLSGGQKQRLSIARALIKEADIFIFDDSFSALDYKTDAILRKNIKSINSNSIVVIVAQRISSIMHADKIVVLNDGKMVGFGTHKELLKNSEIYQEIASSQLSKEELENGK